MGNPLSVSHYPTLWLPVSLLAGESVSLHVQPPPSLQPPLVVQDRLDPFSQCPWGKASWPLTPESGVGRGRTGV